MAYISELRMKQALVGLPIRLTNELMRSLRSKEEHWQILIDKWVGR